MKKTILCVCAVLAAVLSFSGAAFSAPVRGLVIYHTNDVHGYAFGEQNSEGRLTRIGYDRLKALVDADPSPHKLLLDAGDVLHGQSFATVRRGELMGIVLSLVGYDALAAGNHDFDYGWERLVEISERYRINFLAANVTEKTGGPILPPTYMRAWNDLKVGVFGLSTPETRTSTDPRNIEALEIGDPIEAAREAVKALKAQGAEVIVAVTHMGSEPYCEPMSQTIAERVPGIDVIIDGHSHSKTAVTVKREGGETLVASAGNYFENVGRVTGVKKDKSDKEGGGYSFSAETIPASSAEFGLLAPDAAMREAMAALKSDLDRELGVVVMNAPFDLDGARERVRSSSTNLGRVVCAALVKATGADAALLNGGSFRDSIPKGDVTKGRFLSVLPYGNYVYLIGITGADLLTALNHGLGAPGAGGFPQFWGMEVTVEKREATASDGARSEIFHAASVTVGGKPLDPAATYRLAINDFLHAGGDGYEVFKKYDYREYATLEEVFRNYMAETDAAELKSVSDANVLCVVD